MLFIFKEPRRIVLKETRIHQLSGRKRKILVRKEEMMYIPLIETLQELLKNSSILSKVTRKVLLCMNVNRVCSHQSISPDLIGDYCDGKIYNNHPLFSVNSSALQLMIYYDELELCNPLGKKHKIGNSVEHFNIFLQVLFTTY